MAAVERAPGPVSLREVMDEEFARKLQREEMAAVGGSTVDGQHTAFDEVAADVAAAAEAVVAATDGAASAVGAGEADSDAATSTAATAEEGGTATASAGEEVDEDYLLALALQAEEDGASAHVAGGTTPGADPTTPRSLARENHGHMTHVNGRKAWTSNPAMARGWFDAGYTPSYAYDDVPESDDRDMDDDGDDDVGTGGGRGGRRDVVVGGRGGARRRPNRVIGDRDSGDGTIITKHDTKLSGWRNTKALNRRMDGPTALPRDTVIPGKVFNSLNRFYASQRRKGQSAHGRVDAEATATKEGVLDDKTRLILFKLMNKGYLGEVSGVVRAGKESNVYQGVGYFDAEVVAGDDGHESPGEADEPPSEVEVAPEADPVAAAAADAIAEAATGATGATAGEDDGADGSGEADAGAAAAGSGAGAGVSAAATVAGAGAGTFDDGEDDGGEVVAIKVFRTTLTTFKNRADYIRGDHRFADVKLSKQNPRVIVPMWAEKELKNLTRIHRAGIPSPRPLCLRRHVLVMSFIGKDGWAAPQLREAELSASQLRKAYRQTVAIMHRMFHVCHLVHADMSGYNLLWHEGKVVVIDVGQAVPMTVPDADEFLARDCRSVTDFFRAKGVRVLSAEALFELVRDASVMVGDDAAASPEENAAAEAEAVAAALKEAIGAEKAAAEGEAAARAVVDAARDAAETAAAAGAAATVLGAEETKGGEGASADGGAAAGGAAAVAAPAPAFSYAAAAAAAAAAPALPAAVRAPEAVAGPAAHVASSDGFGEA